MSTTNASFQLFPLDGVAAPAVVASVCLAFVALAVIIGLRLARRRALIKAARTLGLNDECSKFVGKALAASPGSPSSLVSSPARLREALARRLGTIQNDDVADRFAIHAGWCLSQLAYLDAPFEGAPKTFDAVSVGDRVDSSPTFTAYVADVDETSLTLITSRPCPYPPHTPLTLTFDDGSTIETTLELKPVMASPEWVLSHTLDADVERREANRTSCSVATSMLIPSGEVVEMRRALRLGWPLTLSDLEDTDVWSQRRHARIADISTAGVALLLDDHVTAGDRLHVILMSSTHEHVVAVPELVVVHTRRAKSGQLRVGARFDTMRLAERTAIADWIAMHDPTPSEETSPDAVLVAAD